MYMYFNLYNFMPKSSIIFYFRAKNAMKNLLCTFRATLRRWSCERRKFHEKLMFIKLAILAFNIVCTYV